MSLIVFIFFRLYSCAKDHSQLLISLLRVSIVGIVTRVLIDFTIPMQETSELLNKEQGIDKSQVFHLTNIQAS